MNKKILISLAVIGVVAAIAIGGTIAYFSDTETSTGNTFTAGAIDLKIDNESYVTNDAGVLVRSGNTSWGLSDLTNQLFFNFADLKPGDIGEDTISIHVDSNDAWACMAARITGTPENGVNDPESDVDTTVGANDGELQNELNFVFWVDEGDNVLETDEDANVWTGTVQEFVNSSPRILADSTYNIFTGNQADPLDGGADYHLAKAWCFGALTLAPVAEGANNPLQGTGINCNGANVTNISQTDGVVGDIQFYAVQSRNNPGFTCAGWTPTWPLPAATVTEGTGWSAVDLDQTNGQSANLGGGQQQFEWFAKARNNNVNWEIAVGTDDAAVGGYSSAEAIWAAGVTKTFSLSYNVAGNATLAIAGETPVSFPVDSVGTLARIGVNVKAPTSVVTTVDNLALSVAAPLSDDDVTVTGGTNNLLITGVNLNQSWTLTGDFTFSAVGSGTGFSQENPAVQFSVD